MPARKLTIFTIQRSTYLTLMFQTENLVFIDIVLSFFLSLVFLLSFVYKVFLGFIFLIVFSDVKFLCIVY